MGQQVANLFRKIAEPCYNALGLNGVFFVGSKEALLANLNRWFPGRGDKAKLATHLGASPSTVTRWLNGERELKFDDLDRIAAFLGKRPQDLIVDYSDPKSSGVTPLMALEVLRTIVTKDS